MRIKSSFSQPLQAKVAFTSRKRKRESICFNYDTLRYIFSWLDIRSLARCGSVCRAWREAANADALWKRFPIADSSATLACKEGLKARTELLRSTFTSRRMVRFIQGMGGFAVLAQYPQLKFNEIPTFKNLEIAKLPAEICWWAVPAGPGLTNLTHTVRDGCIVFQMMRTENGQTRLLRSVIYTARSPMQPDMVCENVFDAKEVLPFFFHELLQLNEYPTPRYNRRLVSEFFQNLLDKKRCGRLQKQAQLGYAPWLIETAEGPYWRLVSEKIVCDLNK